MPKRSTKSSPDTSQPDAATPGSSADSDDRRTTRGRILSAAERLFAEHGFSNVSMPVIAKASGITAGAIYKHYDSKADLFFEVVRRAVQSVPLPRAEVGATRVAVLLGIIAMYTTERLKLLRQLAVEMHSPSANHPKVRRLLRQSIEGSIEQLRNDIAFAQRAGELEPGIDPSMLASLVMVLVMGLMHMETLVPHLVGDRAWHDFVRDRAATLMGLR